MAVSYTHLDVYKRQILTPETLDANFWLAVVLIYYFIATFLPIDKVIGKLYPIFGACLIIMALGLMGVMLIDPSYRCLLYTSRGV